MGIYNNIAELIGRTPLLRANNIEREFGLKARVLMKLESFNPLGSAKDRAAYYMILDAEAQGRLKPGGVIIEPTSGNTGVGLAYLGRLRGYRVILTMPETMSEERKKLLSALGAELILTDGAKGMGGAIKEAQRIAENTPGAFIPMQFDNPANARAHQETTAEEIWADTGGQVDILVAGVGTGGTLTGTANGLKSHRENVTIVAVEPDGSPVLSKGYSGPHGLQGIGAGFVPSLLDTSLIDQVYAITDQEAYETGRLLAEKEGVFVGISSGAAMCAAMKLAAMDENAGKTIVVILPDTGERYLSTPLFSK